MLKYLWPTLGPTSIAGSQFLLTFQLLHTLDAASFGSFSFLMVTAQFVLGIWGALFCAPLPAIRTKFVGTELDGSLRALFTTNLAGALIAGAVFFFASTNLSLTLSQAALFGLFVTLNLLRALGRANAYAEGQNFRTTFSDLTYGVILCVAIGVVFLHPADSLTIVCFAMVVGSFVGILSFGPAYLARQFAQLALGHMRGYKPLWQEYSRWSVVGVITTEATANAHAYIVTFVFGPAGFAAVAASSLFIRPITVVMNAVADFERPRIARQISAGSREGVVSSVWLFRLALWFAWLGSAAVAAGLLYYIPTKIFPGNYAITDIIIGAVVWLLIAAIRILRLPESIVMQAGGEFKKLAGSSVYSCGCSIAGVAALVFFAGPIWSMVGIALGELVFALSVRARTKAFLKSSF